MAIFMKLEKVYEHMFVGLFTYNGVKLCCDSTLVLIYLNKSSAVTVEVTISEWAFRSMGLTVTNVR